MITQLRHHVVDCPICGCPVEIRSQQIRHAMACGHCHGPFNLCATNDGCTAVRSDGINLLERAEQLLQRTNGCGGGTRLGCRAGSSHSLSTGRDCGLEVPPDVALESAKCDVLQRPTALLVEYRDEVFARIATDMSELGMRVVRAHSAVEALTLCAAEEPVLVVANLDLPDQNAWSLAGKIRFIDANLRIWFYQSHGNGTDAPLADYLQVDAVLDYGGDLLGLSEAIVELMADTRAIEYRDIQTTQHA